MKNNKEINKKKKDFLKEMLGKMSVLKSSKDRQFESN